MTTITTARPATDTLVDPLTGKKTWPLGATGRHYVPQGLLGYLTGRILDVIIVVAATAGLTSATDTVLLSTSIMAPEWAPVAVFCAYLLTIVFLYGGIAGTVGTIGEHATRMRVLTLNDGSFAGFLGGGVRALGWLSYVLFALMLNDTGVTETRYVAVRSDTGVFRGEPPVAAAAAPAPHTDQS